MVLICSTVSMGGRSLGSRTARGAVLMGRGAATIGLSKKLAYATKSLAIIFFTFLLAKVSDG